MKLIDFIVICSEDKSDTVTDSLHDRQIDIETNEITDNDVTEKPVVRKKREVVGKDIGINETSTVKTEEISKRSDSGEEMEYVEIDTDFEEGLPQDDTERGKRQIRYYLKNGYKTPGKNWGYVKPVKLVEYQQPHYNAPNTRYQQQQYQNIDNNNYYEATRRPQPQNNGNSYSAANLFLYQPDSYQSQVAFKPSLPDPSSQTLAHNPLNSATQIITKSPPISALNNDPFSSLSGGFYNNAPRPNAQYINQLSSSTPRNPFPDSSYVPSTIVTGKPVPLPTSPRPQDHYRKPEQVRIQAQNYSSQKNQQPIRNAKPTETYEGRRPTQEKEYDEEDSSREEDDDSYEDEDDEEPEQYKHDFKPPYEFTHPSHKYKDIENPFANPNFDFDAYLSKISNGQYSTGKPNQVSKPTPTQQAVNPKVHVSTVSPLQYNSQSSGFSSSTSNYKGMSTPKPFTLPSGSGSSLGPSGSSRPSTAPIKQGHTHEQKIQRPEPTIQTHQQQLQQQSYNENVQVPHSAGTPLDAVRPKLKPPNFKDDRQLPISYSFSRPLISSTSKPYQVNQSKAEPQQSFSVTQKPFVFLTATGTPIILSTPKHQYIVKPENIIQLKQVGNAKPYLVSGLKPQNAYISFKQSTPKPLTTIASEQLSALQQYWNKNPTTEVTPLRSVTYKQSTPASIQKLENLFSQAIKSTQAPIKNHNVFLNIANSPITTTSKPPSKRRPIPKPSPEMNDYYYDDDEQYYYEPAVKPKYMPSTEVKPQRPPMAQNYKEYEDSYEDDDEQVNARPQSPRAPAKHYTHRPESATKNHNDVSIVTKGPLKIFNKNINGKIPVPVLVDYGTPTPNTLIRPEISNYQIVHHMHRNRTMHIRRPVTENGPNTVKPPKYLNQTTLRPYTVRHRLAKPTTVKEPSHNDEKQTRGRVRHPNIVAQMKLTTPRDSHNQETRYTKIKHDDKTNR